jgi:predicted ATPase
LIAISGPAGVGKTRLKREFNDYTDALASDYFFHTGRCLAHGDGVAYWALAEMVRQRFAIPEEAVSQEASAKLEAGLNRWVLDAADRDFLMPRLGALLGVAEPGLARDELFAGWRMFFERLADIWPVILVFEDLQWADDGLMDFVDHLLEWSTDHPIFILVLARPELAERRSGWPGGQRGATVIHLEPLPEEAIGDLLDGLVHGLPPDAKDRIVSQAGGIPLYAIETIRALADSGRLIESDGHLEPAGELGELDIPATLSSLLAARIDALDPEEREVVRTMSVFGGAFPRSSAAALTGMEEERLDPILQRLVRKQVFAIRADPLSPDRGQYAYAQTLLRGVAYEMLSRRERKARHAAAAQHLRTAFPDEGEDIAEVIASHFLSAYESAGADEDADELREQALGELHRAARRAETVGAPERAEQAYRKALELISDEDEDERLALTEAAASMAKRAARWDEALELYEVVIAAHQAAGRKQDVARALGQMARPFRNLNRGDEALERIRAATADMDPDRLSPEIAELNHELALLLSLQGRPEEAVEPLEHALAAAEALDDPQLLAWGLTTSGFRYGFAGRVEQERTLYRGAIRIAERHELTGVQISARANLAESLAQTDDPEADGVNEVALALARRIGDRSFECYIASNTMSRKLLKGEWQEVETLASDIIRHGATGADQHFLHLPLVHLEVCRGRLEAAAAHAAELDPLRDESGDFEFTALSQAADAAVALAQGRAAAAYDMASAVLAGRQRLGSSHEAVRTAWPLAVGAALALGRLEAAETLIQTLEQDPPGLVPPLLRAELMRNRALLAIARDGHETVEDDLLGAANAYENLAYPYLLARAQSDLGTWLSDRGRRDEGATMLEDARAAYARLGLPIANQSNAEEAGTSQSPTPAT